MINQLCDRFFVYRIAQIKNRKELNMGKNIKGLASSTTFNQKTVNQMNGINKNNKEKASPIYMPPKKRK